MFTDKAVINTMNCVEPVEISLTHIHMRNTCIAIITLRQPLMQYCTIMQSRMCFPREMLLMANYECE